MLEYETKAKRHGYCFVIGVDEAGRAPLAGPVVAAAVYLKNTSFQNRITDSKKLSPLQRERAFHEIYDNGVVGVGVMSEAVIDSVNILNATYLAMASAVERLILKMPQPEGLLKERKAVLLIDGNSFKTDTKIPFQTIIKGDQKSLSIACASIVAKVTRDRMLTAYDKVFPAYGFKKHKGYPTLAHKEAIKLNGPTIIHRRSFKWS